MAASVESKIGELLQAAQFKTNERNVALIMNALKTIKHITGPPKPVLPTTLPPPYEDYAADCVLKKLKY
jgi:hypothetical protein